MPNNFGALTPVENRLVQAGRYAALAALFFVPISVAIVNVFVAIMAVSVFCNPKFWREAHDLWEVPVVRGALMLVAALAISTLYSSAGFTDAARFAFKEQKKLLLFPLLIWLFRDANLGSRAHWTFLCAVALTLFFSYVNYFFSINLFGSKSHSLELDPGVVFHNRISQGILVALLCGMAISMASAMRRGLLRYLLFALALLAAINVTLMSNGRSGHLALVIVAIYLLIDMFVYRAVPMRNKILIATASIAFLSLLFAAATQQKNARITWIKEEIAMGTKESTGMRLAFYKLSLELIKERPLWGFGAGSLPLESQRLVDQKRTDLTWSIGNPHNQYLLCGVQMGLMGMALFLWLLYVIFVESRRLPYPDREILRSYWLIFVAICGVNSLLLDFVEGHTFVLIAGITLASIYGKRVPADRAGQ